MAGFRNIIAHDYEDIDFSLIYDVLKYNLVDIEEFVGEIRKRLNL